MTREPTEIELRCAKAAYEAAGPLKWDEAVAEWGNIVTDEWLARVRAVFRAAREPTPDMGSASYAAWDAFGEDALMGPEESVSIWQAMIDAASPPENTP